MPDFHEDQAAGLRRLMMGPRPRVVTILSTAGRQQQSRLMGNLAASLQGDGSEVFVVHAGSQQYAGERSQQPALADCSNTAAALERAVSITSEGYSVARLLPRKFAGQLLEERAAAQLDQLFRALAEHYAVVLVDAELGEQQGLPLASCEQGRIVIQLTAEPESIKQAYRLIKQVCAQLGTRDFGILVSDASDRQAEVVFRNLAQVARRHLRVELEFVGAIPADEHLTRAARLGRAVIDAFPMAQASNALKAIARKLDCKATFIESSQAI